MDRVKREELLLAVEGYYAAHGRHDLPWRRPETDGSFGPYKILVSEVMLQQTQVPRVVTKFQDFLHRFPTLQALAAASLGDVLIAWQGLGYNRRAKFLWQAAQKVVCDFGGELPRDQPALESLPGVGHNTAGAIMAYAFNEPSVFIETNIRTVYIHHFFKDRREVADGEILPLIKTTLDCANPRQFYWMLMDYGTYLKQTVGNLSRASRTYTKQSKFEGSLRQVRGRVLRALAGDPLSEVALVAQIADERTVDVLVSLEHEGLIKHVKDRFWLP